MGDFKVPPTLTETFKAIQRRLSALENGRGIMTYTSATRPVAANLTAPTIIYVSDAAAGSRFQGWDVIGGGWVPLG